MIEQPEQSECPDRYALVGHPVKQSISPLIHGHYATTTGQAMTYELLDVGPGQFEAAVAEFRDAGGKGLNVTLPHKEAACALADSVGNHARVAQAANTLVFSDGKTSAHNTDGIGLIRDLQFCDFPVAQRKILIVGAGGACRGIVAPLLEAGASEITIANRTPSRAEELAACMSGYGSVSGMGLDGIGTLTQQRWDAVINATSASLQGIVPPVPEADFEWGYDLAYAKRGETAFVAHLNMRGISVRDGLGMLVEQAAESFFLWRGIRPDTRDEALSRRAILQKGKSPPKAGPAPSNPARSA